MATEQDTQPRQVPQARAGGGSRPALTRLTPMRLELAAYGVLWAALAGLLWWRVSPTDGFYLDEWTYVHGAQFIWEHLPSGAVEGIPGWDRGPQRLYATLIAPVWGPLGASTAFTVSHVMNVLLVSSGVVPAALFARRAIGTPALRVLAVALGVAIPWLVIAEHLLAENLAFPIFLWTVLATLRAAEKPSPQRQAAALVAILAGALCRLSLAAMLLVLIAAVVAAEVLDRRVRRDEPFASWLGTALRRQVLVVAATVFGAVAALILLGGGSSSLGRYGVVDLDVLLERLVGGQAREARYLMVTYARSLVVGTLILPFVLGVAVGMAGSLGRLGQRMVLPSVVGLSALVVGVVTVSVWTFVAPEERYVFVVITPVAVLAVAALEHLDRLKRWLAAASGITLWLLITGLPMPDLNAGNFFAAPAGAFWTRVVEHRLRSAESDLFGWLLLAPTGWLLLAAALVALLVWTSATGRWRRVRTAGLAAALGVCLVGQMVILWYSSKQELYGTSTAPGGIAVSDDRGLDRKTWIDSSLPNGVTAAVLPGVVNPTSPTAGAETLSFWSKELDGTVAMPWNGGPTPVAPGESAFATAVGSGGLATWQGEPPEWLVAQRDDPRVQFAGTVAGREPAGAYESLRLTPSRNAVWTTRGVGADAVVPEGSRVTMTFDRAQAPRARTVSITLSSQPGSAGRLRWQVKRDGRSVARGRLDQGKRANVTLPVPPCAAADACTPVTWQLTSSRAPATAGAVLLRIDAARLEL